MSYKHGVYASEVPTSIVPPVRIASGLPVVFGTAPVNQTDASNVNKLILCYTYSEAVAAFGMSGDFDKYTLCEFIKSQFALFSRAPVVLCNVFDPATHKTAVTDESHTLDSDGQAKVVNEGAILSTVSVKVASAAKVLGTDYTLAFDAEGKIVASRISTGSIAAGAVILVSYSYLDKSKVTTASIIGGIDGATGAKTGLELINDVFPKFRLVPGLVLAPKWSTEASVAAVMVSKVLNINSHFKAMAITDIPTGASGADLYSEAAAWKQTNNYSSPNQIVCWPKVKLGDEVYHLGTQLAGLICKVDSENDDVPYVSASNKNLQMEAAVIDSGSEVWLGPDAAAYLNGEGIVTALNFVGGWKAWGNRTGAYPGITDVKDAFYPIRRMFNWIGNTLVTTFWQKVDFPITKRLVETIVDSANLWLNGLAAREFILGGRVEFLEEENVTTDLMDGIIRFHVYVTPPSPAREIDFVLEYDPSYLETLFA